MATKMTTIRWPGGWMEALEKLGEGTGGYSAFVRALAWPVLNGQIKVALGKDGQVVSIEGRGADGQRMKIRVGENAEPIAPALVTEGPLQAGRPKLTATEKALRQLQRAAAEEGVDPETLKERIGEALPKKRRGRPSKSKSAD